MATSLTVAKRTGVQFVTANATPVVGFSFQTRKSKAYFVKLHIFAAYSDTSAAAGYWLQGLFRTSAAGVLAQVGATASVVTAEEDTAGMDCTMAASGTEIQVTLTGVAATTIYWVADGDISEVSYRSAR